MKNGEIPISEITVCLNVSNRNQYGWFKRLGFTLANFLLTQRKIERVILDAAGKSASFWVRKGIYAFWVCNGMEVRGRCFMVALANVPVAAAEDAATAFCKEFHQDFVKIHDLEKNTFYYWG